MIAKKCDRCKQFYELYNTKNNGDKINGFMTLNIDNYQRYCKHGPYDLRPSCSKELTEWFDLKEFFGKVE